MNGEKREVRDGDRETLIAIFRNVGRSGLDCRELAEDTGLAIAKIVAVAKRYEGVRFKGGSIVYVAPMVASFRDACPGIKNPRSGICARVAASLYVLPPSRRSK